MFNPCIVFLLPRALGLLPLQNLLVQKSLYLAGEMSTRSLGQLDHKIVSVHLYKCMSVHVAHSLFRTRLIKMANKISSLECLIVFHSLIQALSLVIVLCVFSWFAGWRVSGPS